MKRSFIIPTLLTLLLPVQIINADVQSQNSVLRQHSIEIEGLINNDIRKADSLVKAGKPDEALTYYKSSLKSKDSLYNLITNSQMEEILSLYNMDKLILQREQRRRMFHQACLYISVIIILALLLTNIHIYRSRKRLQKNEKEIRRLTSIAEEANEIKSHFLTNMSYNIRIPLNNVVGFSQLMTEDGNLNEKEKREYSGIIQSNSAELIQLVNNVLDLSRLEANMMKFQIQEYDAVALCNDAIYMARMRNEETIEIYFDTHIETQPITTDTGRLIQALVSTLTYPQKNTTHREITFTLTRDDSGKQICFRISNSPLADPEFNSQEVSIRHDINRLLLQHFGGSYNITADEQERPVINFTYPLDIISE